MDVESNELSKLGAEALRDLYNNLAGVKAFALEQAPDVCQQMVQWQIARGALACAAFFVLCAVLAVLMRAQRAYQWDKDMFWIPFGAFGGTALLLSATLAACELAVACQAYVAPKLFLLEKIAAMLKGLS